MGPSRATAGPGKPFWRCSITTSVCSEIETLKASAEGVEGEKTWGGVSPHHPRRGLGERRKVPQRAEPRPKMDFMHYNLFEVRKKPSGTPFSVFLSDGGAPKTTRGSGNPLFPPLDGPGGYRGVRRFSTAEARPVQILRLVESVHVRRPY